MKAMKELKHHYIGYMDKEELRVRKTFNAMETHKWGRLWHTVSNLEEQEP